MNIDLRINGDTIKALCDIQVAKKYYRFSLNSTLKIIKVTNNGCPVEIEPCEIITVEFRPPMRQYQLNNLIPGRLLIEYEGELTGWFLFMTDELLHFSFYNAWYPTLLEHEDVYEITLQCDERYEMVQGIYNQQSHTWYYSTKNQSFTDCNIMLINKEKAKKLIAGNTIIWYFQKEQEEAAKVFYNTFSKLSDFYFELYGYHNSMESIIVFLPDKYPGMGAYQRTGLTVFAETSNNLEWLSHVLSHEMGHGYSNGASCTSWEDWINETHAEWNALLYELKYNPQFFERLMQSRKKKYSGDYKIRPNGESRPSDVHETGTLIYYEIYQHLGAGAIITLLKTFDALQIKDTEHFMQALSKEDRTLYVLLLSKLYRSS